jgi:hypothetical protein
MTKKSNSTFEVNEDFLKKLDSEQDAVVRAFLAANPGARLVPKAEGQVFPFLKRQEGRRWEICQKICEGGSAKEIMAYAKPRGGGIRDISAGLCGGYSPTSKYWAQSFINLIAAA